MRAPVIQGASFTAAFRGFETSLMSILASHHRVCDFSLEHSSALLILRLLQYLDPSQMPRSIWYGFFDQILV
jgi:hypothetical protein